MAELAFVVVRAIFGPVVQQLINAVKDAAAEARLRDVPEQALNLSVLTEAFLRLVASGLGKLALAWATIVVLGGFSRELVKKDFWFTIAIILLQTVRVIGYNYGPEAKFFVNVPAASVQRETFGVRSVTGVVGLLTMLPAIITLIPFFAATTCMTLSIMRLVVLATNDYGKLDTGHRKGNVKPALIFFYTLLLAQGVISALWCVIIVDRVSLAANICRKYFGTEDKEGKKMVNRYVTDLLDTCISKGVDSTNNRTLVLFASELLQSEDIADKISAVSVLDVILTRTEHEAQAVKEICSSKLFIESLMQLLSSKSIPQDTKVTTAKIVKKLATKLRLADIPGGANCILSLLNSGFMTTVAEHKEMFLHGLLVLGELACDPGNCTEIYNTPDLVSMIIAPVSHGLDIITDNDGTTTEMVKASLEVVAKLTSGAQTSSRKVCHKLSENRRTNNLLLEIFRNNGDQDMKLLAAAILCRLTLWEPLAVEYADVQRVLRFISNTQITDNMGPHGRTLLAPLLVFTVKMCGWLGITADIFTQQIPMTPQENEAFARKLKEIVVTSSNRREDSVSLAIIKAATKLATRMMEINPDCIHYFRDVNIVQNLDAAEQAMRNLERCVVFTGRADGIGSSETLQSLVAEARVLLLPPQKR